MSVSARTPARPRAVRTAVAAAAPLMLLSALPAQAQAAPAIHTVRAGDTMSGIAHAYGQDLNGLLRLNGLRYESVIYVGDVIRLQDQAAPARRPAATARAAAAAPTARTSTAQTPTVTVARGEGWWQLMRRTGVPMAELQRLNGMTVADMLHPGMVLRTASTATAPAQAATTPAPTPRTAAPAPRSTASAPRAVAPAPTPTVAPAASGTVVRYTVVAGDSPWAIAQRFEIPLERLRSLNGLTRTSVLHVGQELVISDGALPVETVSVTGPIGSTFLTYTYPSHVTASANANLALLKSAPQPTPAQMQQIVRETALRHGVDPALALGHAYTESRFQHDVVSPANAIGTMQVIPVAGEFASDLVGRALNLLDPYDNATAGVVLIRYFQSRTPSLELGIGAYYQGLGGVTRDGLRADTVTYVARVKAAAKMF
ncbi:LysM peptidoglycan-binding domain-containing protein [Micrococcus sp.]|uniref:LysM peptidoglycan-binding domain-containing protein n=1 Tax=Micrococcus sp. TaxID=1271 RepID=UPI002A91A2D6|nr:LysM peptidoglycan-binding domain-containing protein [Micrococcus sp.]MDY6055576.1 LysM peptidoglycan-binding domain-containing protein [Micrococcus sp.]